jgi:hypothetical protein
MQPNAIQCDTCHYVIERHAPLYRCFDHNFCSNKCRNRQLFVVSQSDPDFENHRKWKYFISRPYKSTMTKKPSMTQLSDIIIINTNYEKEKDAADEGPTYYGDTSDYDELQIEKNNYVNVKIYNNIITYDIFGMTIKKYSPQFILALLMCLYLTNIRLK